MGRPSFQVIIRLDQGLTFFGKIPFTVQQGGDPGIVSLNGLPQPGEPAGPT